MTRARHHTVMCFCLYLKCVNEVNILLLSSSAHGGGRVGWGIRELSLKVTSLFGIHVPRAAARVDLEKKSLAEPPKRKV